MVAFAIEDPSTGDPKEDPTFFKWWARYKIEKDNIDEVAIGVPLHRCTEKDYKRFYVPRPRSLAVIERKKRENSWYCLDLEHHGFELWGDKQGTE